MTCPWCGNEMREGFLQSAWLIFYNENRHWVKFGPDRKAEHEFTVSHDNFRSPVCPVFRCPDCRKIIVDYTGKESS